MCANKAVGRELVIVAPEKASVSKTSADGGSSLLGFLYRVGLGLNGNPMLFFNNWPPSNDAKDIKPTQSKGLG